MASTAKLLIERGADAAIKNTYGTTALHFSARRGNGELCEALLALPLVDVNAVDNGLVRIFLLLL